MENGNQTKTQADHVVSKLGGERALMKMLGHKHPTTVRGWLQRGFIPAPRHTEIINIAQEAGIVLTPDDFFPEYGAAE